jgi:hypothetical protein
VKNGRQPIKRARERLAVVNTFLTLVERLHDLYLRGVPPASSLESVIIAAAIFKGLPHPLGLGAELRRVELPGLFLRRPIKKGRSRLFNSWYFWT